MQRTTTVGGTFEVEFVVGVGEGPLILYLAVVISIVLLILILICLACCLIKKCKAKSVVNRSRAKAETIPEAEVVESNKEKVTDAQKPNYKQLYGENSEVVENIEF